MAGVNISQLPSSTDLDSTFYVPVESQTKGTKRYPLGSAVQELNELSDRMETALDTVEDISEQATPLMTPDARGGAKLGDGLQLVDGALTTDLGNMSTGPLASMTGEGHAEQRVTSGKNLLPNNGSETKTTNGVTFTKRADGSIVANGTATANAWYTVSESVTIDSACFLSGRPTTGITGSVQLQTGGSTPYQDSGEGAAVPAGTYTVSIVVRTGATCTNAVFRPQLELGSIATEYEPYTGGAPSPSPDYPQEIKVVRGRNLWTFEPSYSRTSAAWVVPDTAFKLPAGEYTLSGTKTGSASVYALLKSGSNSTTLNLNSTVTVTSDVDVIALYVGANTTVENIQLEAGSNAHPYVPYGCVGLDVAGKNLAKPNNTSTTTYAGITWTFDGEKWHANGTATGTVYVGGNTLSTLTDVLPAGTYTASFVGDANAVRIGRTNGGTGDTYVVSSTAGVNHVTFTVPEGNTERYHISANLTTGTVAKDLVIGLQLEKGSVATRWTPYINRAIPIPLPQRGWVASLPDGTADVLTLDAAGGYEWDVATNEVVLDGDETWSVVANSSMSAYTGEKWAYMAAPSDAAAVKSAGQAGYATHYRNGRVTSIANVVDGTIELFNSVVSSTQRICVFDSTITDVTAWNAWLQSNPVTVLYPLATHRVESGYVDDWPLVPEGTEWSCLELANVQIRCTDAGVGEVSHAWSKRLAKLEQQLSALIASA